MPRGDVPYLEGGIARDHMVRAGNPQARGDRDARSNKVADECRHVGHSTLALGVLPRHAMVANKIRLIPRAISKVDQAA